MIRLAWTFTFYIHKHEFVGPFYSTQTAYINDFLLDTYECMWGLSWSVILYIILFKHSWWKTLKDVLSLCGIFQYSNTIILMLVIVHVRVHFSVCSDWAKNTFDTQYLNIWKGRQLSVYLIHTEFPTRYFPLLFCKSSSRIPINLGKTTSFKLSWISFCKNKIKDVYEIE